jgi:hypothetical protein
VSALDAASLSAALSSASLLTETVFVAPSETDSISAARNTAAAPRETIVLKVRFILESFLPGGHLLCRI